LGKDEFNGAGMIIPYGWIASGCWLLNRLDKSPGFHDKKIKENLIEVTWV